MADLTLPFDDFQDGAIIEASEHNANNTAITDHVNSDVVKITGNQTITGEKTFASSSLKLQEVSSTDVATIAVASLAASRTLTIPDPGAAASFVMTEGAQAINGAKTFADQTLKLQETGSTDVVTINVAALSASRAYTVPDAGGSASFVMTAGAQTITGTKSLTGVIDASSASAGIIGEYIVGTASNQAVPTSNQFGDLTSISLTAGDWDVTGVLWYDGNGATWSGLISGISVTSGNASTGLTQGHNRLDVSWANSATVPGSFSMTVPMYRVNISSTTTHYLKMFATYSAGSPKAYGRLSARRVR